MEGLCASLIGPSTKDIRHQFQLNTAAKTLMVSVVAADRPPDIPYPRSIAQIISSYPFESRDTPKTFPASCEKGSLNLVRILVRKTERPYMLDVSQADLDALLSHFRLGVSWHYTFTSTGGLVALPASNNGAEALTEYAVFHHDLFAIAWTHDPIKKQTRAVCRTGEWTYSALQDILSYTYPLAAHVMYPALLASMTLDRLLDRDLALLTGSIAEVENRTQYHPWRDTPSDVAKGSYASLSAKVSGCASALAGLVRIATVLQAILETITTRQALIQTSPEHETSMNLNHEVDNCVDLLKERVKMAEVHTRFLNRRAEVQLTALFNLIAQQESRVSIAVAEDSRTIASASKQDSTAMMTLASMTVIYLPGTFVATVFAIPVFQWDAQSIVSSRFWIYWAFTIPLTIVTVLCWLLWTRGRATLHEKQLKSDKQKLAEQLNSV